jgi:hypothetical protein
MSRGRVARPRGGVALGLVLWATAPVGACAPPGPALRYEAPSELGGYEILVTRTDSLGRGIAAGLREKGFTVRERVQGGGRPTAYVLSFRFEERDAPRVVWLHVRLADTRSGAIVAAVSAPLDSLGAGAAAQARAVVDALARTPALRPGESPP